MGSGESQQTDRHGVGGVQTLLENQLTLETGMARPPRSPERRLLHPQHLREAWGAGTTAKEKGVETQGSHWSQVELAPHGEHSQSCSESCGRAAAGTPVTVLLSSFKYPGDLLSGTSSNLMGAFPMLRAKWPQGS